MSPEPPDRLRTLGWKERRQILLRVYIGLAKSEGDDPGYSEMQRTVAQVQRRLEREAGITLGYAFEGENFFVEWDEELLEELESLDLGAAVANDDKPFREGKMVQDHDLHLTSTGEEIVWLQDRLAAAGGAQNLNRTATKIISEVVHSPR